MAKIDEEYALRERRKKQKLAEEVSRGSVVAKMLDNTTSPYEKIFSVDYTEKKTKAISLLIRPTIYEQFQSICKERGVSVNEAINRFMEEVVMSERE